MEEKNNIELSKPQDTGGRGRSKTAKLLHVLVIILLCLITYSNSLDNDFLYDDLSNIAPIGEVMAERGTCIIPQSGFACLPA